MKRGCLIAALATVIALIATQDLLGPSRDEGIYFEAAARYGRWIESAATFEPGAWSAAKVLSPYAWGFNAEHPSLMKTLSAMSWLVCHRGLGLDEVLAFRLPTILLAAALAALVYAWGRTAASPRAGAFAVLALYSMPRFFYHAHLAAFDAPVAALWAATIAAHARALRTGGRWMLACGVLFGLALETKLNAFFLPAVIVLHAAWLRLRGDRDSARRALRNLAGMLLVGPLVLVALWPYLWFDTFHHLGSYLAFHWHHAQLPSEFLGVGYVRPPFPRSYLPLLVVATVPATTLVLAAIGGWHGRALPDARLWLLAIAVSFAPWLSESTPIYGGTKHWLTAYPFIALFAGLGFDAVLGRRALAAAVAATLVLAAPGLLETWHARRFPLTAYTPLVGGAAGAADLGLRRQYWSYSVPDAFDEVSSLAPPRARVFLHAVHPTLWDVAKRSGALRGDLGRATFPWESDVAVVAHERQANGVVYRIWEAYGSSVPARVLHLDGVPVASVYRRGPGP